MNRIIHAAHVDWIDEMRELPTAALQTVEQKEGKGKIIKKKGLV